MTRQAIRCPAAKCSGVLPLETEIIALEFQGHMGSFAENGNQTNKRNLPMKRREERKLKQKEQHCRKREILFTNIEVDGAAQMIRFHEKRFTLAT